MKKQPKPAYFISFEGGDGTGKTTQVQLLATALKQKRIDVITTREPGGCPASEQIRDMLVRGSSDKWDPYTEALLHYAARREHMRHTIWPALEQNQWVITDRFADSTMAYQGYGAGLGRGTIENIHDAVMGNFAPDLTIILDIDPRAGLQRSLGSQKNESRYELMDIKFHQSLRDGFLDIARRNAERCVVVDANHAIESVAATVRKIVSQHCGIQL